MSGCNQCGQRLVPDDTALVPALKCVGCGRLVPRTGMRYGKTDKATLARAMRAHRRRQLREAP